MVAQNCKCGSNSYKSNPFETLPDLFKCREYGCLIVSSYSKFQYHKCKSKAEQHYDIDQKESTSSVSTHNVWKSPDIAYSYSYRRTNSCKNKAKIRIPLLPSLLPFQ